MNLLGSGLAGVGEEELEEALGRGREEGGGRESRVGVYEISDPQLQVRWYTGKFCRRCVPYSRGLPPPLPMVFVTYCMKCGACN